MRGGNILDGSKDVLDAPWLIPVPLVEHILDHLALQVLLGAAQVAGDDREILEVGELDDVLLAAVSERTDNNIAVIVAAQLGRHGLHLAAKEHVQKQGLDDVIAVVAQGDLGGADLFGKAIEATATQP